METFCRKRVIGRPQPQPGIKEDAIARSQSVLKNTASATRFKLISNFFFQVIIWILKQLQLYKIIIQRAFTIGISD